jgi:hypothetical protein
MNASVTKVAISVSAVGLVIDTFWALSTLFLDRPILPLWPALVLFVLIFPLHFRTVLGLQRFVRWRTYRRSRISRRLLKRLVGGRLWTLGSGLFFGYWLLGMSALLRLRNGGPDAVGGRFYANSHGSLTPISEAAYHRLQLAEQRVFTAIPAAFFLVALLYNVRGARTTTRFPSDT